MNKAKTPKYSPEVRERAVRMVQEHRGEYSSPWAAVESIAPKIGCSPCPWSHHLHHHAALRESMTLSWGYVRARKLTHGGSP